MLPDALEVHGVVDFILSFEDLFERKVVMPLLQCVERYLLVVLRERVPGAGSAQGRVRVGTMVVWLAAGRGPAGVVVCLVDPSTCCKCSTKLIGWLCRRHLLCFFIDFTI